MGYEYVKRPVYLKSGLEDALGSTFTTGVTISGVLTLSNTVTAAKSITLSSGLRFPTEAITTTGGADTISPVGVSFITYGASGVAGDIIIPDPPAAGTIKHIFAVNNTTSIELNLTLKSTAAAFWGTTQDTITLAAASTGSPGGTPAGTAYLGLIAQSTNTWAIFPGSTFNWDFTASTGSTDSTST